MNFFIRLISSIILLPIVFFIFLKASIFIYLLIFLILVISIYEWRFISKNNKNFFFGSLFLIFSLYTVLSIRFDDEINGFFSCIFILTVCISTDIGGYIFGKTFKGPKLTKISPNKTYAGVIGAFFFVIIFVFFINKYLLNFASEKISFGINIFILAILISIFSQLGDILISYFKRQAKVKDSGKLIPGHGGLLDRIDGMIFAFPIFYILNLVFKI